MQVTWPPTLRQVDCADVVWGWVRPYPRGLEQALTGLAAPSRRPQCETRPLVKSMGLTVHRDASMPTGHHALGLQAQADLPHRLLHELLPSLCAESMAILTRWGSAAPAPTPTGPGPAASLCS